MRGLEQLGYEEEFWSDTYSGRRIAILNRDGRWQVYLDDVLQHRMEFDSPEAAVTWLLHRIDQGIPGRLN
jgi:hypothetical protein